MKLIDDSLYILTDFNYATLNSPYIFRKTVECKLPLLRYCHHELASSANTLVLIVQLRWTTLFALYEFKHFLSRGDFKLLNERVHPDKHRIRKYAVSQTCKSI